MNQYHYLMQCPAYEDERNTLQQSLGIRGTAMSIKHILSKQKNLPHLIQYLNNTHRFKSTFGTFPEVEIEEEAEG